MLEKRDGSLWVGSEGLFRLKDGGFTRYGRCRLYLGSGVTSLFEDRAGQLWINGGWRPGGQSSCPCPLGRERCQTPGW
jgi:ligand-binding sensor domain-containing protein